MPGPRPDHYFAARPSSPSRPGTVRLHLDDLDEPLLLSTDSGVFAGRSIDPGTALLLEAGARPSPEARVVADVGCGYGPIAVALAVRSPDVVVWAIDVNERALELTAANADAAGVGDRVRVAAPDDVPAELSVDGVWSNPPIRVGKVALHTLLTGWLERLAPGCSAHLVVARNLGADSLHRWLDEQGNAVVRRVSRRGYRLLDVTPGG